MRKCNFLGSEITRLIAGDNPFSGHSYIDEFISGKEMKEYCYNSKKLYELYFQLEEAGFDCMLPLADPFIVQMLKEYKRDGGKMKFIFQSYTAVLDRPMLSQLVDLDPLGLYISGSRTDVRYEKGEEQEIKDVVALGKEILQKPIGIGSHYPEVIEKADREDWGADFYVCALHNLRRDRFGEESGFVTGKTKAGITFYQDDRAIMLDTISKIQKPCIAFKIFSGGHLLLSKDPEEVKNAIRNCYSEVYGKIKPGDIAAIGMFTKYKDQIREDMDLYNEYMDKVEGK